MIEHPLHYFGTTNIQLQWHGESQDAYVKESERSDEEKAIDQLESAQLDGSLARDARKAQQIILRLSRQGVQIMTPDKKITIFRITLLNVLFTVAYEDGFGKYNCAVLENCLEDSGQRKAHVFQAASRLHADQVMKDIDGLFKKVEEMCRNLPLPQSD